MGLLQMRGRYASTFSFVILWALINPNASHNILYMDYETTNLRTCLLSKICGIIVNSRHAALLIIVTLTYAHNLFSALHCIAPFLEQFHFRSICLPSSPFWFDCQFDYVYVRECACVFALHIHPIGQWEWNTVNIQSTIHIVFRTWITGSMVVCCAQTHTIPVSPITNHVHVGAVYILQWMHSYVT